MGTKDAGDICYNAALPDEPMFVLLARDAQAPELVRKWAKDRESKLEKVWDDDRKEYVNQEKDADDLAKISEARYCAAKMEVWRYENNGRWRENHACKKSS